jgi:integrase/recombinase XerD
MTTPSQGISPLRQRMMDDMRMRGLAPKTQANYLRVVRQFTVFLGRSPETATVEDLRRYQLHLVDHGVSPISLNCVRCIYPVPCPSYSAATKWAD